MHLVRDLLDNQVYDRDNRRLGKVDGIVLTLRRGKPPRVSAIEMGLPTLAGRIAERLGDAAVRLEQRLGVSDGRSVRVPIEKIERVGLDVHVDIDGTRTRVFAWEQWIRRVLIGRIPGANAGKPESAG